MSNWTAAALIAGTGAAAVALAHQAVPAAHRPPAWRSPARRGRGAGRRSGHSGNGRPAGESLRRDHQRLRRDHHHPDGQRQDRRHQDRPGRRRRLMATVTGVSGPAAAASWRPCRPKRTPSPPPNAPPWAPAPGSWSGRRGTSRRPAPPPTRCSAALDRQASRFRSDSELSWLHRAGGGLFLLSDGLAEAVGVALAAARWTGGLADPTVGGALICLGYDRDFAAISPEPPGGQPASRPRAPGLAAGAARRAAAPAARRHPAGPRRHGQGRGRGPRGAGRHGRGRARGRRPGQPGR